MISKRFLHITVETLKLLIIRFYFYYENKQATHLAGAELPLRVGSGLVIDEVDETEAAVLSTFRTIRARIDDYINYALWNIRYHFTTERKINTDNTYISIGLAFILVIAVCDILRKNGTLLIVLICAFLSTIHVNNSHPHSLNFRSVRNRQTASKNPH